MTMLFLCLSCALPDAATRCAIGKATEALPLERCRKRQVGLKVEIVGLQLERRGEGALRFLRQTGHGLRHAEPVIGAAGIDDGGRFAERAHTGSQIPDSISAEPRPSIA